MTDDKKPTPEALEVAGGLDDVANALGRPALLVGEHAEAVTAALAAEKAAHEATHEATQVELSESRFMWEANNRAALSWRYDSLGASVGRLEAELEATKAELASIRSVYAESCVEVDQMRVERSVAQDKCRQPAARLLDVRSELEALRKPLEGDLSRQLETVRESLLEYVGTPNSAELHALDAIEVALRAKGEPQAVEPVEPRPIVVGSKVRIVKNSSHVGETHAVTEVSEGGSLLLGALGPQSWWRTDELAWLSDPPATPAPELPRKVEPREGK